MPEDFDLQRQSPLTPEGQIEAAGRFSRGLSHRYGADRVRKVVGSTALVAALAFVAIAVAMALG